MVGEFHFFRLAIIISESKLLPFAVDRLCTFYFSPRFTNYSCFILVIFFNLIVPLLFRFWRNKRQIGRSVNRSWSVSWLIEKSIKKSIVNRNVATVECFSIILMIELKFKRVFLLSLPCIRAVASWHYQSHIYNLELIFSVCDSTVNLLTFTISHLQQRRNGCLFGAMSPWVKQTPLLTSTTH